MERTNWVSNPITFAAEIWLSELKIRKMIVPKDKHCSKPNTQKIFDEFIFPPVNS